MQTLDVIDSALQWETERQNRLHQQALELKKKQAADEARQMREAPATMPAAAAAADAPTGFPDKVGRIPDMRSALIPLDEAGAGDDGAWSKPFALTKADLEPWTSFLAGYNQSRLFLQPATGSASAEAARAQDPSRLDYAVRALLALKRVPVRVLLEPPVQINRQVEYQDLEAELRASNGRLRHDTMLKLAMELHQKQLAKAVEAGRKLGDDLYEAMMGEGYGNLVRAWERAHGRKPSVEELHVMLSTGRVKPIARSASTTTTSASASTSGDTPNLKPAPVAPAQEARVAPPVRPPVQARPLPEADDDSDGDATVTLGAAATPVAGRPGPRPQSTPAPTEQPSKGRPVHWYLLHVTATAASAAAVAWLWLH